VVDFLPKLKLEIAVADADAERVVETIIETAASGRIGDGKIFVTSIERAVRIRTGEEGDDALVARSALRGRRERLSFTGTRTGWPETTA
jgi:hypothetical protein